MLSAKRQKIEKKVIKEHEISDNSDDKRFLELNESEKKQLIQGSKKDSTNKATLVHTNLLRSYLQQKKKGILEEILDSDLPDILSDFYCSIRTKSDKETYSVQSQKCIRVSSNRYFKSVRGINIITDTQFIQANETFDGCKAKAKKEGKGVKKKTEKISEEDMLKLSKYFSTKSLTGLDPRKLQQCVMFYVIYFFCQRGQENLKDMTLDTYSITQDEKGRRYVYQITDEIDKNHNSDDSDPTNQGRMYASSGECIDLFSIEIAPHIFIILQRIDSVFTHTK